MNLHSLLGNIRKKNLMAAGVRRQKKHRARLHIDTLEDRAVPAVQVGPTVEGNFRHIFQGSATNPEGWGVSMAADPMNPNQIVAAYVMHASSGTRIALAYTTNGGTSWNSQGFIENRNCPRPHNPPVLNSDVSDPSIAWDRFGNFWLTYTEDHDGHTAGHLILRKYRFSGAPSLQSDRIMYSWVDGTEAYTPQVAIDSNRPTSFDPVLGNLDPQGIAVDPLAASQLDQNSVKIFLTYNLRPAAAGAKTGADAIVLRYSADGGQKFQAPLFMNDEGFLPLGNPDYVFSKTVFTPGRANEPDSGGRMVTLMSRGGTIRSDSISFSGPNGTPGLQDFLPDFGLAKDIANATQTGTTVEIETTTPHHFTVGTRVNIAGVSVGGYNGTHFVTAVVDANRFQYTLLTTGLGAGTGGTATLNTAIVDAVDPGNNAPHIVTPTVIPIHVPAGAVPKIDNIAIDLRINHENLSELDVRLRSPDPDGAGPLQGRVVQLVRERITNNGTDRTNQGIGLAGTSMDSTFVDSAPQTINQGTAPYRWFWRPELDSLEIQYTGLNPSQFEGEWEVIIRDNRASNVGSVPNNGITLWLGQGIRSRWVDSSGVLHRAGTDRATGAVSAVAEDRGLSHPNKPTFAPQSGVGPGLVATVDTTVGAFSPYQNRVYFAYSTGSSIQVMYTDGVDTREGNLWSTAPTTVDAGYLPQIAVDPSTGALYVAYYSAKYDASNTRSTMFMSSAINMPDYRTRSPNIEFAPGEWVTEQETALDPIRTKTIITEPIPSNGPVASDVRMWGNSIGMTIFDSHVVLVYPGNRNNNGTELRTQNIEVQGGPRVVWTDSGPVLGDASISGNFDAFSYNLETFDGRNAFSGFGVEFDRIIDPATFNPDDVKVIFRGPEDDPVGSGTEVLVDSIHRVDQFRDPVDTSDYGSKRFFVQLDAPQTNVGTYSVLIGADSIGGITSIKDRVRDQKFTYTANGEVITYNYPLVGTANDQIEDFAGGSTPLNTVINVPTAKNITTATQNAFGTVTITTTTAHNLTVGSTVIIAGVSVPGYNGTHTVTNVVGGTQFQYSLAPGLANGAGGTARSPNAFSLGTVILDITVRVDITHEQVSDLQIDLIAPNNQAVRLVRQGDAFGVDFQNTQFNDGAALTLGGGFAPYTDTFIPAESLLGKLFGDNPGGNSGNWTLRINDMAAGDTGVLNSWSMTIVGASTPAINIFNGNFMDQDGDGVSNESPVDLDAGPGVLFGTRDGYALPNPTPILDPTLPNPGPGDNVITPFVLPYSNTSMPIVVPGPRLLESRVIGHPSTTDQLVKNTSVSSIDLYFDRIIDAASFSAADVIRITGPLGNIPLTGVTVSPITAGGALLAAGTDSEYFRISGFAAQNLSGTYTIQLSSQIADGQGNLLDTNFNAGVGNLVGNVSGSDVTTEPYGGDPLNGGNGFIVPAKGTTTVNLNITDGYLIQRATANLTVVFPSLLVPNPDPPPAPPFIQVPTTEYANLEGRLIAPNGTTVLLFSDSPTSGEGNMTNLTFTDASFATPTTPPGPPISVASIEDGFVANGFNNPILPLAQLISQPSSGTWKLQIKNKGNIAARVDKFALELDKPVIPSGLGEAIADRTVVSFRIANTDGSTALSKSNWSPVGPAPQIDLNAENSTAGRVSSIAVDPSDPSGNTVYAAGASGGVWRTTNFLTRDPDGPVWVPLADFGPNNATNVGYLAVYNSKTDPNTNGDPEKTVILVGTGSEALNVIDEEDERRFDGIGFLLSEDAGKTWKVLDSTDNYDNAIDKYRPFVDAQAAPVNLTSASQVGTTVTIQTPTPHAYPVGTVVTISGVSVAGYNGTFVVTGVPGPNHFTYNTAAGLANGTGGTSQAVDRRNHFFMGTVVNKIVFEKNPNVFTNRPIIWAAVGQGVTPNGANMEGLWRSIDGARTWTQVFQGEATDFVLAPGSQLINSNDRPTIGYLAVQGVGTYFISNLDSDLPTFTLMNGGVGRPTVNGGSMTVLPPLDTPIGAFGRIAIASPAFVRGDALANVNYQHWLYVAVSNTDGTFRGLYMTKDRGDNWTRVKLTGTGGPNGGPGSNGGFSDAGNDIDIMINPSPPADDDGGNHSITLAVDPNDPNVVYFGSNRLLKVDTTLIADPYNATPYNHSNNEGGTWTNTFDGLQGGSGVGQNILNLVRNPFSPFTSDTSLSVSAANFQNNGRDVRWVLADAVGDGEGSGDFNWVSQIISFIDPITGMARVAFGTDEGITSFVIDPNVKPSQSPRGNTNQMNGFNQHFQVEDNGSFETDIQVNGKRNGNLQVARLYSGDVQPSLLAAAIAQSQLYGAARRLGDVQVSPEDPGNGHIVWDDSPFSNSPGDVVGRIGRANYVTTDQTGSGNVYILRRIDDIRALGGNQVNFFQISKNGGAPISFTNGLFSTSAGANFTQWTNETKTFAVNPIDPNGIVIGSTTGRVYVTRNMGVTWDYRGEPTTLDSTTMTAFAFGAPNPGSTNLNDYIYAGSTAGNIWVTKTGGGDINSPGDLNDSWVDIVGGIWGNLDGSPIQKIVPSPTRGSNELFAVTRKGIYRMEDWDRRDPINPSIRMPTQWEDITTNIRDITSSAFSLGDDWVTPVLGFDIPAFANDSGENPITTIGVDWRPTFSPIIAQPVLYVGGDGGVFRAVYNGPLTTWARFTGDAENAASDGGGLPLVKVTDIDLALGNVDPNTGRPVTSGAPDAVIVSTLGRGMWAIGLDVPPGVSGPKVIDSDPKIPLTTGFDTVTVTFDKAITGGTFDESDAILVTPSGVTVGAIDVTPISTTVWEVEFPFQSADGTYTIRIGPNIASGAAKMDQDGDAINGEAVQDQFVMSVVVGRNDLMDFVKDTYTELLGRQPTTAESLATAVKNMDTARFTAIGTVLKELLGTYNSNASLNGTIGEARQRMIERLVDIPGAFTNEIGDLLPGFILSTSDRDAFALALKNGQKRPQTIIVELMATTDPTKPWYNYYRNKPGVGATLGERFMNNIYADLFPGLGINPATELHPTTYSNQLALANGTDAQRQSLVANLVNGATVTYYSAGYPNGKLTTNFKTHFVNLAYNKFLGRNPTSTELSAAVTSMGAVLVANSIQGTEWVYWRIMSGKPYFEQQSQTGGPDGGLHTNRAWAESVIQDRIRPLADQIDPGTGQLELDSFSQKVLSKFSTQRAAFVKSVIFSASYRTIKINEYYQLVHGRLPTASEMSAWQNALATGSTYPGLISARLGNAEYFTAHTIPSSTPAQKNLQWANAVYQTLLNRAASGPEANALAGKIATLGRAGAAASVINGFPNAVPALNFEYRQKIVKEYFQTLLGRDPSGLEMDGYLNFLKTNRWEFVVVDMLANGLAVIPGSPPTKVATGLPREFWEVVT